MRTSPTHPRRLLIGSRISFIQYYSTSSRSLALRVLFDYVRVLSSFEGAIEYRSGTARRAPAEQPEEARDVHVHRRVYRTMYIVDVAYYYERGDRLQFLGASKKDTMKEKGVSF